MTRQHAVAALLAIHARVDARAAELAREHTARLRCARGCHACCVDDLTVLRVEAERIRAAHAMLLREGTPHAPGACAFLGSEGECRIYPDRPYVCRTQGLPLRWLSEDDSGEIREQRDICPLNAEGPALDALRDEACWLIGPVELELTRLQDESETYADPHAPARDVNEERIPLRALFARSA